jgi:hypothetical protein
VVLVLVLVLLLLLPMGEASLLQAELVVLPPLMVPQLAVMTQTLPLLQAWWLLPRVPQEKRGLQALALVLPVVLWVLLARWS